jgi:hypothetical protein
LSCALTYRKAHKGLYPNQPLQESKEILIPWTSSLLIRSLVFDQINITIQLVTELQKEVNFTLSKSRITSNVKNETEIPTQRRLEIDIDIDILFSQIHNLGDFILDGYNEQISQLSISYISFHFDTIPLKKCHCSMLKFSYHLM